MLEYHECVYINIAATNVGLDIEYLAILTIAIVRHGVDQTLVLLVT